MLVDWALSKFSVDLGIDLGTANTLVFAKGQGVIMREPSVVAVERKTGEVLLNGEAVGEKAYRMRGVVPEDIEVVRPMRNGVIADFDVTEKMLRYFIRHATGRRFFLRPDVVIAVPAHTTDVHRDAVINAAEGAGARNVYLVDEPLAAGLGVGLPVTEPQGSMIVDIGGGTTEIGILTLGSAAYAASVPIGGDKMDDAIREYVLERFDLVIGERTAERLKMEIGSVVKLAEEYSYEIKGQDASTQRPRRLEITSEEVREALLGPAGDLVTSIQEALGKVSPELAADLMDTGITLAGGGAMLTGIDRLVEERTGMPTAIAENALEAVVLGTGVFLDDLRRFAPILNRASRNGNG
ncbi:MAG: rod shape-determining protein [Planctomycetes bacterium]|nr:rod shape-determining protein [Planctomycetota bacterium]